MNSLTAFVLILALSVAPALGFLALWEFLEYLRDDALIEELELAHELDLTTSVGVAGLSPRRRSASSDPVVVDCPTCHAETVSMGGSCLDCGNQLDANSCGTGDQ